MVRLRACFFLVCVLGIMASAQTYTVTALPSEVQSVEYYTGTESGVGYLLSKASNTSSFWVGKEVSGQITRIPFSFSTLPTDDVNKFVLVDGNRLVQGVFDAGDGQPVRLAALYGAARNSRGVTKIKILFDTSGPSGSLDYLCGDGTGLNIDGQSYLFAALGAGPNRGANGKVLFSASKWGSDGASQGIYELAPGRSPDGRCWLKTVVETDPDYDLLKIVGEPSGTFLVHRSFRAPIRKTEVARLGVDGKVKTVLSKNAIECCDRVVVSSDLHTAWSEKGADNKYRLLATQTDGSVRELVSSDRYLVPVSFVGEKFVFFAVGNSLDQLDTLERFNFAKNIVETVLEPGNQKFSQTTGITLGANSINPGKTWMDALGNVRLSVTGVNDRVIKIPNELIGDIVPPPPPPPPPPVIPPKPLIKSVVPATGNGTVLVSGQLGTIFGDDLCGVVVDPRDQVTPFNITANTHPEIPKIGSLYIEIGRCRVKVDGQYVPVLFGASWSNFDSKKFGYNSQVNFTFPWGLKAGKHTIETENRKYEDDSLDQISGSFEVVLSPVGPSLFPYPALNLPVLLQDASDYSVVTEEHPAYPGTVLVGYGTGFGSLQNPLADGTLPKELNPVQVVARAWIRVTKNGKVSAWSAEMFYAVASPQFIGVQQIAFRVPLELEADPGTPAFLIIEQNGIESAPMAFPFRSR